MYRGKLKKAKVCCNCKLAWIVVPEDLILRQMDQRLWFTCVCGTTLFHPGNLTPDRFFFSVDYGKRRDEERLNSVNP